MFNREDDVDTLAPGEQPARRAAYADLVAAVLDLRSPVATATFDRTLSDAVAAGMVTDELARELRWLQRESMRDVVTHAANVLPAALVALDATSHAQELHEYPVDQRPAADDPVTPTSQTSTVPASESEFDNPDTTADEIADDQDPDAIHESAPVDLTARRLLVAGLRAIPDSPFP